MDSKIVWHLSMTIRSDWYVLRFSSMNPPSDYDTADSGVINTIRA